LFQNYERHSYPLVLRVISYGFIPIVQKYEESLFPGWLVGLVIHQRKKFCFYHLRLCLWDRCIWSGFKFYWDQGI